MIDYQEDDKKQKAQSTRLYKTYGLNRREWLQKLEAQNGVCAVCKSLPGTGRLNVDHIHVKGFKKMSPEEKRKYIRGLCCFMCNTAFKGFEKTLDGRRNRKHLEGTIKYFQQYKLKGEDL